MANYADNTIQSTQAVQMGSGPQGGYPAPSYSPTPAPSATPTTQTQGPQGQVYGLGSAVTPISYNPGYSSYQPTVSTTTISNANKVNQISQLNNAVNQISSKGITTDANGTPRYADGSFYQTAQGAPVQGQYQTPTQTTGTQFGDKTTSAIDANNPVAYEDAQTQDLIDQMRASTDADTKRSLDNIQQKFANRKADQERINASGLKNIKTALMRGGVTGQGSSAQYAPISSQGVVTSQESYGLRQLANLDSLENDAIAEAKKAQSDQNYKLLELKYNQINDIRKQKLDIAGDISKKAAERNQQSTIDNAISDVYSQGITDVPGILAKLKEQGISATAKDISDSFANTGIDDINKLALEASKNGAPLSVVQHIGQSKSLSEATIAAGKYTGDPLDRQYKQAQIDKIYQDIASSGASANPAEILAYAQQYASTGTIPPGLPKGMFGIIAQTAKEFPKDRGTLVDKNTGIKSGRLSSTEEQGISALYDFTQKIGKLESLYGKDGIKNRVAYNTLRSEMVDLLARSRTGAAISASEEALYKSKIPGEVLSTPGIAQEKLKGLQSSIGDKLDNQLSTNGISIYGYSKVNTPNGQHIVGETITMPSGNYRVNPDGSLTQI